MSQTAGGQLHTHTHTSEGSEILTPEYLTSRIQICRVHFCLGLGIILEVILKKEAKIGHKKMYPTDLNSPRQEHSNGGLGIVVVLLVRWEINVVCAYTGKAIQLYK